MARHFSVCVALFIGGVAQAAAAELVVGAPREDVIAVLGEPLGRSSAGAREVLNYAGGRVFLREGKVEELDAKLAPPPPVVTPPAAPAPAPAEPKPAPEPAAPPPEEFHWIGTALLVVFLGVVLLLGKHWMRVALRAQSEKKPDLLSR